MLQKCCAAFHVVGLKCSHCGSYNTCNDSEPTDNVDDDATTAATAAAEVDDDDHNDENIDKNI